MTPAVRSSGLGIMVVSHILRPLAAAGAGILLAVGCGNDFTDQHAGAGGAGGQAGKVGAGGTAHAGEGGRGGGSSGVGGHSGRTSAAGGTKTGAGGAALAGSGGAAAGGRNGSAGRGRGGHGGTGRGGAGGSGGEAIIEPDAGNGGQAAGAGGAGGEGGSECAGTLCGASCIDVANDKKNCGACGYACVHGRSCVEGRCTPAWQTLVTENAPAPRLGHTAAFMDGKFVVLGGSHDGTGSLSDVAAYDVLHDAWSTMPELQAARCGHISISTGAEIYAFGGLTDCSNGTTVGPGLERYVAGSDAWETVSLIGEPSHRYATTGVWTGSEFFIYGGGDNTLPTLATGAYLSGSTWADAGCSLTQCDRSQGVMFLDGQTVRFMGGSYNPTYPTPPVAIVEATSGLAYDLGSKSWTSWTYPAGTAGHIAYRYADDGRRLFFLHDTNVVTIYDRASSSWVANDTAAMPSGFCAQAAVAWSGSELLAWSGDCGSGATSVGGRYQPRAP